ncbi:anthranilate phosphoribosyltransferase [Pseudanabaena sp. FACHB-1998]|uniref:anthranilate phosphoribosyltransferase n=1 Tax=Pseudanabaena sp. FACHB-1998 TaxID=2692858 RepID=UPI0016814CA5|nr:anthranilate phosphoribosyltransferase [Pseudanabaena sp. FACHB-1998]MBD2176115.1 anthranilate phosphoribosyltransferase [Pseudanabaena sp. FACHB-1998]
MEQNWSQLLKQLMNRQSLANEQATALMQGWLEGAIAPELSGAILTALQFKGVEASELAAMANVLQSQSEGQKFKEKLGHIVDRSKPLIDTCGTGGDGASTFNISTSVAFVAAAAGVAVAKHGNRAVSSRSGSADVLEAIGINLTTSTEKIYEALPAVGITFLFAPNWHPAMKAVGAIRKSLGVRTVFNLIGPLVNPLHPTGQVLGVYNKNLTHTVAEALRLLDRQQAVVLHSREGMDEAGLGDLTDISYLANGIVTEDALNPEELGLSAAPLESLSGGNVAENAEILRNVLQGKGSKAQSDCVALNAGLALRIGGAANSWAEGVKLASTIIQSGAAWNKAEALVNFLK